MAERKRILVVDDEAAVRDVLTTLLDAEGYDARALPDGAHVVALCRRWPPDVLLLDMMMTPLDGWGVLRMLADAGLTPALPVIVLSAQGSTTQDYADLELMARARGARAWSVKPFSWDELRALIECPPRPPHPGAADA